jgi:ribonuclease BN (tRNA processing enzyme)
VSGGTRVLLLGTGTPNAEPDRAGPCTAVLVGERAYLVDAGAGVLRLAVAAAARGVSGLAPERLADCFLTHLHSDHTLGVPELLLGGWVLGRRTPLRLRGPRGTRRLAAGLAAAFAEDIQVRGHGAEPTPPGGHAAEVTELLPGDVVEDGTVRVRPFAVRHAGWEHAFGYRLETPDRTVVISGDTAPDGSLVRHYAGADVLVHEVYSETGLRQRPPAWQAYHRAAHTSGVELGQLAAAAQPGLLVLTHVLCWGADLDTLVGEVRQHHDGPLLVGYDDAEV